MIKVASNINSKRELLETEVLVTSTPGLTGTFTAFSGKIYEWCLDNHIDVDFKSKWGEDDTDYSIWEIEDGAHRTMFALRWVGNRNY